MYINDDNNFVVEPKDPLYITIALEMMKSSYIIIYNAFQPIFQGLNDCIKQLMPIFKVK